MTQQKHLEYCRRVGRHIRLHQSLKWFLVIFFPIALGLSAFTTWHNYLVGTPTTIHILMRVVIGYAALGVGTIVFFIKVIRPAIAAAAQEAEEEDKT